MSMRWVIGLQGCLKNRKVCLFGSIFVMCGGASLVLLCLRWALVIMFIFLEGFMVWVGGTFGSLSTSILYSLQQRGFWWWTI